MPPKTLETIKSDITATLEVDECELLLEWLSTRVDAMNAAESGE